MLAKEVFCRTHVINLRAAYLQGWQQPEGQGHRLLQLLEA